VSTPDPVLDQFREEISATDRAIVDAVNTRLELVGKIKSYKESQGIDFLDQEREERLLRHLAETNGGPLSAEGLHELFTLILDLTKREVSSGEQR